MTGIRDVFARPRPRLIAAAVAASAGTGVLAVALGGGAFAAGAIMHGAMTVVALAFPAAIAPQVIAGQLLVASLVIVGGVGPILALPVLAGVVATAELLAVIARFDGGIPRELGDALPRAALAVGVGGGAFGVVAAVGVVPGPTGIVAVALAAGACALLASRLLGERP